MVANCFELCVPFEGFLGVVLRFPSALPFLLLDTLDLQDLGDIDVLLAVGHLLDGLHREGAPGVVARDVGDRGPFVREHRLVVALALVRRRHADDGARIRARAYVYSNFFLTLQSGKVLANFERPVLGCIEADFASKDSFESS